MTLRIDEMRREAEGVVSLLLDGAERPRWEPGAHVTVNLPSGRTRQYSLCGTDGAYRIAVLDVPDGRGGSREIHRLRPGQKLDVGPPVNRFELVEADSYLFVAGGIGITPILPMVRRVVASGRSWKLVYGGRSRATMAFLDELERFPHVDVIEGRIDVAGALDSFRGEVYCCGPEPLLDAMARACSARGRPLHLERFTAPAGSSGGGGFRVVLARSGEVLECPADRTVLETLRAGGIDVPTSCEQGICGTCETRVLSGRPDHRDALLTDAERAAGETMMVCVSRCLDDELVLDL